MEHPKPDPSSDQQHTYASVASDQDLITGDNLAVLRALQDQYLSAGKPQVVFLPN
jgi:hypothetical protein